MMTMMMMGQEVQEAQEGLAMAPEPGPAVDQVGLTPPTIVKVFLAKGYCVSLPAAIPACGHVGMNSLGMSTFTTTQSQGFWQSTGLAGYLPQNQNPQGQAAAAMSQYLQGPSYTLTETWSTGGSGAVPVYQVKIIGPGLLGQPFSPGTSLQNAFAQSCPKVPTINTSTTCDNLPEPEKSKCLKIKAPKINCQGLPSL